GEIIAFVDDDVVLFPDWAEEMAKAFDNDTIIGATGSAFPLWENNSLKWLPEEFYWLISCTAWTGWQEKKKIRGAFGANMAFKREAFSNGCQFSPTAGFSDGHRDKPISEDIEFSLRIKKLTKKDIIFAPRVQVWHRVIAKRLSFRFIVQRSHHIGSTRRIIRKYYSDEFGSLEQENQVLKSVFKRVVNMPKTLLVNPTVTFKQLYLVVIILTSSAIGYLIPIPSYKLDYKDT
ncbi:MAG TPA: hypothetical protein DCR71_05040, partial [Dehalococcoidia bacterium]|nr:hypothetical protein [Dehalococcoidia bacterium]